MKKHKLHSSLSREINRAVKMKVSKTNTAIAINAIFKEYSKKYKLK